MFCLRHLQKALPPGIFACQFPQILLLHQACNPSLNPPLSGSLFANSYSETNNLSASTILNWISDALADSFMFSRLQRSQWSSPIRSDQWTQQHRYEHSWSVSHSSHRSRWSGLRSSTHRAYRKPPSSSAQNAQCKSLAALLAVFKPHERIYRRLLRTQQRCSVARLERLPQH